MANRPKLSSMTVDALIKLRDEIGDVLSTKVSELRKDLARLTGSNFKNGERHQQRKRGPKKGVKVAPKYRSPKGELWSGRGLTPRWLVAEMKKGKKLESFAIK